MYITCQLAGIKSIRSFNFKALLSSLQFSWSSQVVQMGIITAVSFNLLEAEPARHKGIHAVKMMSCTSDLAGADEPRPECGYRIHTGRSHSNLVKTRLRVFCDVGESFAGHAPLANKMQDKKKENPGWMQICNSASG